MRGELIPSLSGARGVAAAWVFAYHGINWAFQNPLTGNGWLGVDLFFVLSGFLLMHSDGYGLASSGRRGAWAFAVSRFFRIYPLTTVSLALIMLGYQIVLGTQFVEPNEIVKDFLLATRWWPPFGKTLNEPIWSISVEIIGYVFFPLIAFVLFRIQRAFTALITAACAFGGLAIYGLASNTYNVNDVFFSSYPRMAGCFIGGAALYRARTLLTDIGWASEAAVFATTIVFAGCFAPEPRLLTPSAFGLLVFCLSYQKGLINAALSSPLALFFGRISFPLYLIHFAPAIWIMSYVNSHQVGTLGVLLLLALYLFSCMIVAYALHVAIERPAHRLGKRLAASMSGSLRHP